MSVHIAYETPQDVQEQVYEMVKALGKDAVSYTHLTLPTNREV